MEMRNEYCERYRKDAKKALRNNSPYAVIFDQHSKNFKGNKEFDLMFIKSIQHYANDKLRCGDDFGLVNHLYLNDVYRLLGLPEVSYGWRVGWIYYEDAKENKYGDNFIDFEIKHYPQCSKIIIDFNVDGDITPIVYGIW